MSRSYPIWVSINSCSYQSPKSYGVRHHSDQYINVGTSGSNSHFFGKITLEHKDLGDNKHRYRLFIDDVLVKEGTVEGKEFSITKNSLPSLEEVI